MRRIGLGHRNKLAGGTVKNLTRADSRNRIKLALDRGGIIVKLQRSRVTPLDQQATTTGLEQRTRVADVEVQLFRRTVLAGFLIQLERLLPAVVVHDRLHVGIVKVEALTRALGLHDRCREGLDREVGLRVTLLEDA